MYMQRLSASLASNLFSRRSTAFSKLLFSLLLTFCCIAPGVQAVTNNAVVSADTLVMQEITENVVSTPALTTAVPTLNIVNTPALTAQQPVSMPKESTNSGQYPKLSIEGYKEYEFMKMEKAGDPLQYENDASYKIAAAKILPTAGSSGLLRERLRLDIEGQLSEKLSVSYHIEQEPDLPDKFDIKVRYDKTELTFGDFNADFQTREFVNFNKAMNGFRLTSYDNWYDLKLVTAKEKSTAKEISFSGNGQTIYSLGQSSVLEGSVKVYVNDYRVEEGADYTIDYFEGKIIFRTIKSSTDRIRVQYEFTDPIEDLIPVSTKVDFLGLQGTLKTFEEPRREKSVKAIDKSFRVEDRAPQITPEVPIWLNQQLEVSFTAELTTAAMLVKFTGNFPPEIKEVNIRFSEDYMLSLQYPRDIREGRWYGEISLPPGYVPEQAVLVLGTDTFAFSRKVPMNLQIEATMNAGIKVPEAENPTSNALKGVELFDKTAENSAVFENTEGTRVFVVPTRAEPGGKITLMAYAPQIWQAAVLEDGAGGSVQLKQEGGYWTGEYLVGQDLKPGTRTLVLKPLPENAGRALPISIQVLEKHEPTKQSVFLLEGTPLVFGSEAVYLNGNKLVLYEDYLLNYDTGELKLQKATVMPSDNFEVKYQYLENKKIAETFNGQESQGPYKLQNSPILRKSVRVFIDSQQLEEGKDYTFDYVKGEVFFSLKIARAQRVTVEYAYQVMKEPLPGAKPQEAFSLQTTYLRESADSGKRANEQIAQQTDSTDGGIVVSQNGTLIILDQSKLPIREGSITSENIIVDGVKLSTITSASVIENYRGYISGVSPAIAVSAQVQVAYEYYKTTLIPFQTYDAGNGMTELILENKNTKYLPVVYQSEEVYRRWYDSSVGLWREDVLHRGENYVWGPLKTTDNNTVLVQDDLEEYWSRGYITFVTRNAANIYNTWQINSGDQIKMRYKYTQGTLPDFGQVSHQVYGFNTQYLINPDWSVGLEAMKSQKAFDKVAVNGQSVFAGSGTYGSAYTVAPIGYGLVENSEQVYLGIGTTTNATSNYQVNYTLQNRNDDYVISYTTGQLRFKNGKNPGPGDIILVNYSYYADIGVNALGATIDRQLIEDTAYKVNTAFKTGDFTIGSSYMDVGKKFETIGSMRQQPGTKLGDLAVAYAPNSALKLSSFAENRHVLVGTRDNNEPWYKSSYLQKYDGFWEFWPQQTMGFNYQQADVVQESASVVTRNFDVDTLDRIYGLNLNIGPSHFRTLLEGKGTEVYTNILDRQGPTTTLGTFQHINNVYKPWNNLSFATDYQYDNTDAEIYPWYVQTITRYQETIDYLTYPTWRNKLDYTKRFNNRLSQAAPRRTTENETVLTNYFYATTLTRPAEWSDPFYNEFYTHFDKNYAQDENPLLNQAPDTEEKDNFNFSFRPWDLLKISRDSSRLDLLKGDERDAALKNTHRTAIEDFRPLKLWAGSPFAQDLFSIERVAYSDSVYDRDNRLFSTTTSGNSTYETEYAYDLALKSRPLDYTELKYTYAEGDKQTAYDTFYGAAGYTDSSSGEHPQTKRTYGLSYTPGDLMLGLPLLSSLTLSKFGFWADRAYSNLKDETMTFRSDSPTETITKLNTEQFEDNQSLKFNPLATLALDFKRKDINEYRIQTGSGTRESQGLLHDLHWTYDTPIAGIQLNGYFTGDSSQQYTAPSLDRTIDELHDDHDTWLKRSDEKQNYGLAYTPFTQLTLRSSYTNNDIYQDNISGAITGVNVLDEELYINSKLYSAGAVYRPFSGFSLSYDWDFKRFQEGAGERSTIQAKYQPFDWLLGTCVFNYQYVHNSGYGLNEVEQFIAQQNQSGFVATSVGKVSNERMTGSLDLQILNDINSLVVEGTEVVATWTLIRLVDRMNSDNNYSVNALYLKGRIIF